MKLEIESGTTFYVALKQLKTFFDTQCADYPYLKSKMHIYVDLRNDKRQVCPDNEKEFAISAEKIVDVLEQEKLDTFFGMIDKLESELLLLQIQREKKERDIARDKRYLDTAEEKGRKKERINSRTIELQKHIEQHAELQNRIYEHETILSDIQNERIEIKMNVKSEKIYGRKKRTCEMVLCGQSSTFNWIYSNISGITIRYVTECIQ